MALDHRICQVPRTLACEDDVEVWLGNVINVFQSILRSVDVQIYVRLATTIADGQRPTTLVYVDSSVSSSVSAKSNRTLGQQQLKPGANAFHFIKSFDSKDIPFNQLRLLGCEPRPHGSMRDLTEICYQFHGTAHKVVPCLPVPGLVRRCPSSCQPWPPTHSATPL